MERQSIMGRELLQEERGGSQDEDKAGAIARLFRAAQSKGARLGVWLGPEYPWERFLGIL